jgi:predicted phosphoribosyltransferase
MRAALQALRQQGPAHLIVAVPVAAPSIYLEFLGEADDVICALMPDPFFGVGFWYQDFEQTSDQEVRNLLTQAAQEQKIHSRSESA